MAFLWKQKKVIYYLIIGKESSQNCGDHSHENVDIVTESSPGLFQTVSKRIIEKQHNDCEDIQTFRRNDHPGHQSPDLTVQNIIGLERQIAENTDRSKEV